MFFITDICAPEYRKEPARTLLRKGRNNECIRIFAQEDITEKDGIRRW